MEKNHRFSYRWKLEDAVFLKNRGTVFSTFACGGGSTMGYKLAGFNVIGCNEIDPRMAACYKKNHQPKYCFIEPIQTFKLRNDLPDELFHLDILDGSPPCSSFSMSGNRDADWGKEKKFREGQSNQVLDTLFFDFIDLAKKLQPKIVIAENVKGLMMGDAKQYVIQIYREFELAGYNVQHWLLDDSEMGVPQRRERVFFIALRNDLCPLFNKQKDLFTIAPYLDLKFKEPIIRFGDIRTDEGSDEGVTDWTKERLALMRPEDKCISDINERHWGKISRFNALLVDDDDLCPTITATEINYRKFDKKSFSSLDYCHAGSYPVDYDFIDNKPKYMVGMSVPPIMTAQIATEIHLQWLSKLKSNAN